MTDIPTRKQIIKDSFVLIETKENQGTGKLIEGVVEDILTSSDSHPHGIKVRLKDDQVGRVKKILIQKRIVKQAFVDLDKKVIPKTEDRNNEFKEFYQYDQKIKRLSTSSNENKQAIAGIKKSVQERLITAICSFGNDRKGGFVYLGIKSDGTISGLEQDKVLGRFSDYNDSFANHIRDMLGRFLDDKVFLISHLQMKFRKIEKKTICIIQIIPATKPLYLQIGKEKLFFVRGSAPRAEKLDIEEQYRYIKERFPNHL